MCFTGEAPAGRDTPESGGDSPGERLGGCPRGSAFWRNRNKLLAGYCQMTRNNDSVSSKQF